MHKHDKKNYNSWVMWLMILPCFLLLVILFASSGKGLNSIGWQWLIGILSIVGIHVVAMKMMYGKADDEYCNRTEMKKKAISAKEFLNNNEPKK